MCASLPGTRAISITACRYLHEALDVVGAHAPDLSDTVADLARSGEPYVCMDGTLIRTDRVAVKGSRGTNLWSSGQRKAFGGNIQVLTDPHRLPSVGFARGAGLHPRHHCRPHPRHGGLV